jgi:peptidoglycan hydrolase-like protein with peptidoglycan-binding domain
MIKRIWAGWLALLILVSALPSVAWAAEDPLTRCNLRLRKQAKSDSDTLVVIPGGTEVTVLSRSGGWVKTSYQGHTGYVSADYLMEMTRSGYYPLHPGDENPYVLALQQRLIEMGYLSGTADGKYGDSTSDAVYAFQRAARIDADGIAGGETQRTLYATDAPMGNGVAAAPDPDFGTSTSYDDPVTPPSTFVTLKKGDRGEDVRALQARLIELNYLSGRADGIYGSDTRDAVLAFQRRSNLTADGKAGKVTQTLLYSSGALKNGSSVADDTPTTPVAPSTPSTPSTPADDSYTLLKKGMTSPSVTTLQKELKSLGYLSASATGYFGSQTYAAVVAFQRMHNLKADGIAGNATQSMLYSDSAKSANAAPSTDNSSNSGSSNTDSPTVYPTLKKGMTSSEVTSMQERLRALNYMTAKATGYFGSATYDAVMAFQRNNGLLADGVAGVQTLEKLYSGNAVAAGSSGSGSSGSGSSGSGSGSSGSDSGGTSTGNGKISGPSASSVQLLHWFNQVKPSLKSNSVVQVFDPVSKYTWNIKALSLGRHFDSEPLTAQDTTYMNAAFGGVTTWTPLPVWVKLPSGTWTLATMHNTPHLSGNISNNNFDGHLCIHFLRDMDECRQNDPSYGVQHQNAIRTAWKKLTGITVE